MKVEGLLKPLPIREFHPFPRAMMGPGALEMVGPEALEMGFKKTLVLDIIPSGMDIALLGLGHSSVRDLSPRTLSFPMASIGTSGPSPV